MDRHWIAQNILDLVIDPKSGRDRHISGGSFMRNSRYLAHPSLVGKVFENSEPPYESPATRPEWSFVFDGPVTYFDPHGVLAEPQQCATSPTCAPATPIFVNEI